MRFKPVIFKSHVAKRIFLFFCVAALIPLLFLVALTYILSFTQDARGYSIIHFQAALPWGVVISLLLVLLLSITQIRRSLIPLKKLIEGTRALSQQDFDKRVVVRSGDEFEELADAFNKMSKRLGRQFHALETLAAIDRIILSSLNIETIIETILSRSKQVVLCDYVAVMMVNQHDASFYSNETRDDLGFKPVEFELKDQHICSLLENPKYIVFSGYENYPEYLQALIPRHLHAVMSLPIIIAKNLVAVLFIAFRKSRFLIEEGHRARELADRIAVALANASWEEKLYYHAHYDSLTGLPNRLLLKDRLQNAINRAERSQSVVAIMFIDVDRFKPINDSLGHDVGDKFLQDFATRLRLALRKVDTLARLGGDEFVIVLPDINRGEDMTHEITTVADKVLKVCNEPFHLDGHDISVSISVGVAMYPDDGDNLDDLLKNADAAMYHAKDSGRAQYQFYSSELNAQAIQRLRMESLLHRAVGAKDFKLTFQPQISINTGELVGAEVLLYWEVNKKIISPSHFIPIAEESGLISGIGEWVLREACKQYQQWQSLGLKRFRMAINVSAKQFQHYNIADLVSRILKETQMRGEDLELEITEQALMIDIETAMSTLGRLRKMGVHLAIDDFGTGYSSLNYLKHFPVNSLKIDKSFITDVITNRENSAIAKAIVALAHSLELRVIAEGIENQAQLDYMRGLDCDEAQGYLIAKPMHVDQFESYLQDQAQ